MKPKTSHSRLDIAGNGSRHSAQEILAAALKRCRQNLGYLSIFATLPALLLPNIHEARTENNKHSEATVPEDSARFRERPRAGKASQLLKRQSKFRLPQRQDDSASLAPAAGPDDCPGRGIPAGSYSAVAPYIENGDTTGANNTFSYFYMYSFGYLTVRSPGPDHIYSFILTERGPNPKIEISTTSQTFNPVIYVLEGGYPDGCPAGPAAFAWNGLIYSVNQNGTATLDRQLMNWLPLNVPLYLVIDSGLANAGPYTLKMQDVTLSPPVTNAIDDPGFFVRRHYFDFLGRDPDPDGQRFWTNEITSCGSDQACIEVKRINDSGAFFLSIEFQETGYLLYRAYRAAYGNLPNAPVPLKLEDFWNNVWDLRAGLIVNQPGWQQKLENNKQLFFNKFVGSTRFIAAYPLSLTPAQYVDALFATAGVTPTSSERQAAINEFGGASSAFEILARIRAFRRVVENPTLSAQESNRAFVLMQYFGYLQRNPNDAPDGSFVGFNFWLDKLNRFNGDFHQAEMVKAFLSSIEYRKRFGP